MGVNITVGVNVTESLGNLWGGRQGAGPTSLHLPEVPEAETSGVSGPDRCAGLSRKSPEAGLLRRASGNVASWEWIAPAGLRGTGMLEREKAVVISHCSTEVSPYLYLSVFSKLVLLGSILQGREPVDGGCIAAALFLNSRVPSGLHGSCPRV